jgi:hypothetical protein
MEMKRRLKSQRSSTLVWVVWLPVIFLMVKVFKGTLERQFSRIASIFVRVCTRPLLRASGCNFNRPRVIIRMSKAYVCAFANAGSYHSCDIERIKFTLAHGH